MNRHFHMLWVTARPEMFLKTQAEWMKKAVHPERIHTKVAVSSTEHKKILEKDFDVIITRSSRKGVAYSAYILTTTFELPDLNDIIILASDDFYPPDKWDKFIEERIGTNCCLVVNDGITKHGSEAVTLPIVDGYAFKSLNQVLYSKAYMHMFSDAELYKNCKELGIIKNIRHNNNAFIHQHYARKLRERVEIDVRNQRHFYEDKKMFHKRMTKPLKVRLR